MHSFIAYIDESGDDGFGRYRVPNGQGGASNWLGISALLIRATNNLDVVEWRDEIREKVSKNSKGRSLHFKDFKHAQRKVACQIIATKPIRFMSAIAHKPSLDSNIFKDKNQLYFYITRYLVERVSWFCRDMRPSVKEGNGQVKIVFSRRGGMSYDDFKTYLYNLKSDSANNSIHWPAIDINAIDAQDHPKVAGLQLADCVASATASAFEADIYGNIETTYLQSLRTRLYQRRGNVLSYGLKILPRTDQIGLSAEQQLLIDHLGELG